MPESREVRMCYQSAALMSSG